MNNSKIEWTDHTFNPWWGCMKVSAGCKNCYAEALDRRWKGGHWGPGSSRRAMSEAYWTQPLKWDKAAAKAGVKAKVFCASMADVFEGHPDTLPHLARLFQLIDQTPNLIWQLLTKHPENIIPLLWDVFKTLPIGSSARDMILKWLNGNIPPANVWIGTSVENQAAADERIPRLLGVPAEVRFLSCEPLLGPVDLTNIKQTIDPGLFGWYHKGKDHEERGIQYPAIRWVIAGGESGHDARPMHPDWVRGLRDQCKASEASFFFKQQGEWCPGERGRLYREKTIDFTDGQVMVRTGKKAAGRLLDGIEHNEFPKEAM